MLSEIFEKAFGSMGAGCRRTCACGKTYYNPDMTWDWEEDELETLEKDQNAYAFDYAVGGMEIGGEFLVFDCDCGKAEKYENFIIGHEQQLAEYLNARAKELEKEAEAIKVRLSKDLSNDNNK